MKFFRQTAIFAASITFASSLSANEWEIPFPFGAPEDELVAILGADGVSFEGASLRRASYTHYALSCFLRLRLLTVVSEAEVDTKLEAKEQMEQLRELSAEAFKPYETRYAEISASIRDSESDVEHYTNLTRSIVPHIRAGVDALADNHPNLASAEVLGKDYNAVLSAFNGFDDTSGTCGAVPDKAAPSDRVIPYAEGWLE